MAIARTLKEYLNTHDVDYDLIQHPRSDSSTHIARLAHIPGDQLAKSVLLEDEQGYVMAVIPSTHRLDLGALHHRLHRMLGLAVESEVAEIFSDCDPGAIPALGEAYHIDAIVDDGLLEQDDVYFEAGDHIALVHMSGRTFSGMMADIPHGQFTHRV